MKKLKLINNAHIKALKKVADGKVRSVLNGRGQRRPKGKSKAMVQQLLDMGLIYLPEEAPNVNMPYFLTRAGQDAICQLEKTEGTV